MPLRRAWALIRGTLEGYIADDAFSRGASIAYFTLFSLAPVLLVIIAVAGMVFGRDAARGAIVDQLSGLMGRDTAGALQAMLRSASDRFSGALATVIGLATVLLAATGVFGEVQMALNAIWKAKSRRSTLSRLVQARIASLGLVIALGFILMVSLVLSAALAAIAAFLKAILPAGAVLVTAIDVVVSATLITSVFAIMYKTLPDRIVRWRDALPGALFATILFEGGKYLIALYIGQTGIASSFGGAGAIIVMLLWIFYSAQIFLLGAEFSRAWTLGVASDSAMERGEMPLARRFTNG
ncbi:MAG: YihY/virulence factor BrkB family protein [Reyranella sp.]|uniref:YihY/virulence factor BrkB family protein n=1 Tax=Reyranella sp. TaxID=1929291 RepID=UPI003D0A3CE6